MNSKNAEAVGESRHFIDGDWVESVDGKSGQSIDPSNGEVIGAFAVAGVAEADAAIAAAVRAFRNPRWSQSPRTRQAVMLRWADRIESRAEELARLISVENGRAIRQARLEIGGAVSELRYYAGLARHIPGHVVESEPGVFSTILREPLGVAGIIVPWNAPVGLLVRSLAPAMAAGCASVIKPAPQTTIITARVLELLSADSEMQKGAVNMVGEVGHEVAKRLVSSGGVDVLSFTGSSVMGQQIMADASSTMKRLSLELGGKSCCLVFEDVDITVAAPKLAAAATVLSGQQCTTARRILVHRSRVEEMKHSLAAALKALVIGPGLEETTDVGPMVDAAAQNRVGAMIERACDEADEVLLRGGKVTDGRLEKGCFQAPTLVAHGDSGAFFCQEEIFGPFAVIEAFDTESEAIALANHTVYGLSGSVWTHDGDRAMRVARALRNGTVWINDHNRLFPEAETGGYRHSGLGRLHGYEALADFTTLKHVYQDVGVAVHG
ncbi:MAG: aldehyde dehydrogenase [Bordetella sp. SCN 67-23]|nr:aldehyde dehydrogenase family protein [Burkholderiales bacterium]ODS75321.1 MAG: aldehyde dehydrogenase [Bordetella sp. SCN 67-23]OJW88729.1 MAG: aldehyde dehydrogenase [Burkholderiales bacterium 67-32]